MNVMLFLLPIALLLGAAALVAFLWSLRSGQFDDLDGDGARILFEPNRTDNTPAGDAHDR